MSSRLAHLARRFARSLSTAAPSADDQQWAAEWLEPGEDALFASMTPADQRHSIEVARRFQTRRATATREEMAGALLHDVGKTRSGLGTFGRVAATVLGPRTTRFRQYHDHERIGAELAKHAGADVVTVNLIRGDGEAATALRDADNSI